MQRKQTRRECFLIEMDWVGPWKGLIAFRVALSEGRRRSSGVSVNGHLRVQEMQSTFSYSDSAMGGALYETTILRQFVGLRRDRIPDESTILNFGRLQENTNSAKG